MTWLRRKYNNVQLAIAAFHTGTPQDVTDQVLDLLGIDPEELAKAVEQHNKS